MGRQFKKYTRDECNFTSFTLVSSVFFSMLFLLFYVSNARTELENSCFFTYSLKVESTLVSSVFSHLFHSFRVCSRIFSTRFECSLVSVWMIMNLDSTSATPIITWLELIFNEKLMYIFPTRFECVLVSFPLVSSAFSHLLHSFRVYFRVFIQPVADRQLMKLTGSGTLTLVSIVV